MFEGSLVESRGLVASKTQKWTALGSLTLQCVFAALLVSIPMLRPEVLPVNANAPHITVPELRQTQVVQEVTRAAASAAAAMSVPATAPTVEQTRGFVFHGHDSPGNSDHAPVSLGPMKMGNGWSSLAPLVAIGSAPAVVPRARNNQPVRVSSGVVSGLLLAPITPIYPAIAKAARVEGSVVVEAVISKAGRVESLNAVSGPPMLRNAALDAVKAARYAPYKLNGEPVDVQTVITVVFRMGA
jgi:protein TonB